MNDDATVRFRERMAAGEVLGLFMKSMDPAFVEVAGHAGMDFAILDMEHGPVGYEGMQNNIRAAQAAGLFPVVRVDSLSEVSVAKALDIGALGVQVPQVASAEEAEAAVRYAKFHPLGRRGVCRFVRAARYSAAPAAEYFSMANRTLVIIQLEGREAVARLDEILAVDGIDVLFIGPYDLSQSLGVPGQTTHPSVVREMRAIVDRARAAGKTVGTFTDSGETMRMWKEAGVSYLSYSVDVGIFREACASIRKDFDNL